MRIVGRVDGMIGQGIGGWVCCPDCLEERLWVELLAEGCPLQVALAENYHPDAESYGNACYGFWLPVPLIVLENGGMLAIRVANTPEFLVTDFQVQADAPPCVLRGEVAGDTGLIIAGWAMDPAEPDKKLRIGAWRNGRQLCEGVAAGRLYRPASADGHGFTLTLPADMADGHEHVIDVLDEEGRPVPGSPILVCVVAEGLAQWYERHDKLTPARRALFISMLERYELLLPKSSALLEYALWDKTFPPPPARSRGKLSVGICVTGSISVEALKALRAQTGIAWAGYFQGEVRGGLPPRSLGKLSPVTMLAAAARAHEAVFWMTGTDLLRPGAVTLMAEAMRQSGSGLVYADQERRGSDGSREPLCKPAWDPHLFFGLDYLGPMIFSREVALQAAESLHDDPDLSGSAARARVIFSAEERGIGHLPLILSAYGEKQETADADESGRRPELQRRATAMATGARIEAHPLNAALSRVRWPTRIGDAEPPLVSVIIPTRDKADLLRACVDSLRHTAYPRFEILIVDNGSTDPDALELLRRISNDAGDGHSPRVLEWPGHFNYASINNYAAKEARGSLLCFCNNDIQVLSPQWLDEMVGLFLGDLQAGCVGAKLLWPNNLVQHGGVIAGVHGLAAHVGNQWMADEPGYMCRNLLAQQWSAVTAACMLTSASLFFENQGFNSIDFPVAFNDADYCLRLRARGKRILFTPFALVRHHESASRGSDARPMDKIRSDKEMHAFRARWGRYDDPFYNPNLSLSATLAPFTGLALPPRSRSIR